MKCITVSKILSFTIFKFLNEWSIFTKTRAWKKSHGSYASWNFGDQRFLRHQYFLIKKSLIERRRNFARLNEISLYV